MAYEREYFGEERPKDEMSVLMLSCRRRATANCLIDMPSSRSTTSAALTGTSCPPSVSAGLVASVTRVDAPSTPAPSGVRLRAMQGLHPAVPHDQRERDRRCRGNERP